MLIKKFLKLIGLLLMITMLSFLLSLSHPEQTANPAVPEEPFTSNPADNVQVQIPNFPIFTDQPIQEPHQITKYTVPSLSDGTVPVLTTIPTTDPVVFLGIDDGAFKDQSVVDLLKTNNIQASLFLADTFINSNPDFFKLITAQGSIVENHTINHNLNFYKQSYDYQYKEICGMNDKIESYYGARPLYFRPPGGGYSRNTLLAAKNCNIKAIITWIAKANGGSMQYQVGNKLRPGDIVLMHFRPEFKEDLKAFTDALQASGLHTELLEDYLQ